jgi:pimeloyl-ACP methyl ester carboxylesterase
MYMAVDKFSAFFDSLLTRLSSQHRREPSSKALLTRFVATPVGTVRVYDSTPTSTKPCVIFVPDGPNVIEHYEALMALLSPHLRVVCFDMPGFGHSLPQASYTHSLDQGAQAVLGVMDALNIDKATLAFSCANGFYAMRAAQKAPQRITQLLLSQTPSLHDMHAWVERIIPKPLKVPVLGQLLAWLFRRKTALPWYRAALPRTTDAAPFQDKARYALACGSCFCLAGVVQGLLGEAPDSLRDVSTPCTVIWGAMDRSHKPTKPQSLLDCMPHARIVHFDDCGHFPDIEQPERYAALLLRVIA